MLVKNEIVLDNFVCVMYFLGFFFLNVLEFGDIDLVFKMVILMWDRKKVVKIFEIIVL